MNRVVLHCDCNGFYASVECIIRPELQNVPMAVGGDPESRHGIILAKNELAKGYGVKTAETIWQAKKKCPQLVIVPPHMNLYSEYSQKINQIYLRYTDQVEPFGIDESWLDVTGSCELFGSGKEIADQIRSVVKNEIGLTISVGVSFNKVFSKLGSDYKKPDATTVFSPSDIPTTVHPLPVGELLYVGKATTIALKSIGIHTIGDLAAANGYAIESRLGKSGKQIWNYARGEDHTPVARWEDHNDVKSVGNGLTFRRNLLGKDDIKAGVTILADQVATRMREKKIKCTTVQVAIRSTDFKNISRQKTLNHSSNLTEDLIIASMELILENWNLYDPIRMITITATNLIGEDEEQMSFFGSLDTQNQKRERLERTMDDVRKKFGFSAVSFGRTYASQNTSEHDKILRGPHNDK